MYEGKKKQSKAFEQIKREKKNPKRHFYYLRLEYFVIGTRAVINVV